MEFSSKEKGEQELIERLMFVKDPALSCVWVFVHNI